MVRGERQDRCIQGLVGSAEENRPFGRTRLRWKVDIKIDLQEVGGRSMDWIDLAWERNRWRALVNAVMNLRVP